MASLNPRRPYSPDELEKLYPKNLELQLVQVLVRHGERTPLSIRFQNTGLTSYWPLCNAARHMTSVVLSNPDGETWDDLQWKRRLEVFGEDDSPTIASDRHGNNDGFCQPGEITDLGRRTTYDLGRRLRHLYVDQLQFMPKLIANSDMIYIRATPIPRALESVQQTFSGLYPKDTRAADFPPPSIVTRAPADETLFPNDGMCRRFSMLSRAFAQRAANRWNGSMDMGYLTKKIGKWMAAKQVAVDSRPRLSGIMDTVNATRSHDGIKQLPPEFYDPKVLKIMERIAAEEWFRGYEESREYRMLGIGGLVGDIVERMVGAAENKDKMGAGEVGGETRVKFALSGCHDTTLAGTLASLGAFDERTWPPFTSHLAVELFRNKSKRANETVPATSWWSSILGSKQRGIGRRPLVELTPEQREPLDGYYVRLRYNDEVVKIPGCKARGKHLQGDDSFCTLEAFKSIVDKFTPKNWKQSCLENLDKPSIPDQREPAGH